jgi:hypothetical protein
MKTTLPFLLLALPAGVAWKHPARRAGPAGLGKLCHAVLAYMHSNAADSGEGRRTVGAAIDESVSVVRAALSERFVSRREDDFTDKLLTALRFQFGGNEEKNGAMTAATAIAQ